MSLVEDGNPRLGWVWLGEVRRVWDSLGKEGEVGIGWVLVWLSEDV